MGKSFIVKVINIRLISGGLWQGFVFSSQETETQYLKNIPVKAAAATTSYHHPNLNYHFTGNKLALCFHSANGLRSL